jgi:carbon monoxide dehydrogenase subunit G
MKLEQSFEVAAPLGRVWAALVDVERVAPCLPGASVTGRKDDGSYDGTFQVKIGPTSASYTGKLQMEAIDESAHTATMQAAGTDKRGQGGAKATIVSSVAAAGAGSTKVDVSTDYHITGRLARFGRGGMIEEISNRLLGEFAKSLQAMLAGDPGEVAAAAAPADGASAAGNGAPPADGGVQDQPEAIGTAEVLGTETAGAGAPGAGAPGAGETASEVLDTGTPAAGLPVPGSAGPSHPPETEPMQGLTLVASALWSQAKRNPLPLFTALLGFLMALRIFRRRG